MRISDWSSVVCSSDLLEDGEDASAIADKPQDKPQAKPEAKPEARQPEPAQESRKPATGTAPPPPKEASPEAEPEWTGATVKQTVREALRDAMAEEMRRDERVFLMGDEVAEYQGAYKSSEGHTSELPSLMRISYAVFFLKKNTQHTSERVHTHNS